MLLKIMLALPFVLAAPLQQRAGGPVSQPIPANCTLDNPLPQPGCEDESTGGYQATSDFASNLIYQAYYQSSMSADDTWKQCEEQCYGYGTPGTCKFALLAYNVTTPPGWLGTAGGQLSPTACFMYNQTATPADFELAPDGEYADESAANIEC